MAAKPADLLYLSCLTTKLFREFCDILHMRCISAKLYYFILAPLLILTPQPADAKCLGYPWLTEMHAKELGISCKSAHKQILDISKTISKALSSDRDVVLPLIGEFKLLKSSKKNSNSTKVSFRIDKSLTLLLDKEK